MSIIDQEERVNKLKRLDNPTSKELRERAQEASKDFKTSWVSFAQVLFTIWRDKLYEYWGYEKFDHYTEREIGLKKSLALKLVKTYEFVEQNEPAYLKAEFADGREANSIPEMDAIHVLRQARLKKEVTKQDYQGLRREVFDKGRSAVQVRQDLTTLMKERKQVDPDEERELRNTASLRRLINAIRSFKKDAQTLKLVKVNILKKAEDLIEELQAEMA